MFGECPAHIIMDGVNYRHAVEVHKNGPDDKIIREHLKAYQERGIVFVRDGGDALGVSARAKELAPEYGIDYRTPIFAIHKEGHYGSIVGNGFATMVELHTLVQALSLSQKHLTHHHHHLQKQFPVSGMLSEALLLSCRPVHFYAYQLHGGNLRHP